MSSHSQSKSLKKTISIKKSRAMENTDESMARCHTMTALVERRAIQRKIERRRFLHNERKKKVKIIERLDPWFTDHHVKGYWSSAELYALPANMTRSTHDIAAFNIQQSSMPRCKMQSPTLMQLTCSFSSLLSRGEVVGSSSMHSERSSSSSSSAASILLAKEEKQNLFGMMRAMKKTRQKERKLAKEKGSDNQFIEQEGHDAYSEEEVEEEEEEEEERQSEERQRERNQSTSSLLPSMRNTKHATISPTTATTPSSTVSSTTTTNRSRSRPSSALLASTSNRTTLRSPRMHKGRGEMLGETLPFVAPPSLHGGGLMSRPISPATSEDVSRPGSRSNKSRPSTSNRTGRRMYLDSFLLAKMKSTTTTTSNNSSSSSSSSLRHQNAESLVLRHGPSRVHPLILHRMTSSSLNLRGRLTGSTHLGKTQFFNPIPKIIFSFSTTVATFDTH